MIWINKIASYIENLAMQNKSGGESSREIELN